jgi:trehalose 6-phosphate phosphatase
MPKHEAGLDHLPSAAHAALVVQHAAFFLDFDGTLIELAASPDAVVVPDSLKHLLAALADLSGGAVAIVSGRSIESIDALLAPLVLPVAGLHGAEWRDVQGAVTRTFVADPRLGQMEQSLAEVVAAHPGLLLETKAASLALHYRNAPDQEEVARLAVERLIAQHAEDYVLQVGKMVFEIKPAGVDKGRAIATLLATPPFLGRTPCFAGDDVTDEAGFAAVNALGGLSIKVGEGQTSAMTRLDSVVRLHAWLAQLVVAYLQLPRGGADVSPASPTPSQP